ncbi:TonB family protein [Acidicapsa acidisoli]|uniref:TonB family protein n=1 Tax=Acidicapsa acidisoli TaxID=1615681 RepID=UPI0021E0A010|nr:TonB family protein [Acidicapsa acidisoli]
MSNVMHVGGQFEPEFVREPIGKHMAFAVFFHVFLVAAGLGFALLSGLFPHNNWGGNNDGGAIAVQLVSNALPLPADRPPNDNVLSTETPSEAPAPPAPKAKATVDETAIPIPSKIEAPKKQAQKKQEASQQPKPVIPPPIAKVSPHPQPPPKPDNRAQYGEQSSSSMARTTQPTTTSANGQVAVTAGTRGFNYPYYVETIQRKVFENTRMGEVDPRTPKGTRTYILFTVRRDGTLANAQLDKSSGSPTLDQACLRAARRVDTFGPLPSPPSDGNLSVSYYCDYDQ